MGGGIDQGAVVVLAMDFDQFAANRLERLHADRLIVDEGAAAPVGHLRAAQDQVAIDGEALFGGGEAGGMVMRRIEDGDHLALRLAGADQTAVAAASESERESVEQDGFAGAGLARSTVNPAPKSSSSRSISTMSRIASWTSMKTRLVC